MNLDDISNDSSFIDGSSKLTSKEHNSMPVATCWITSLVPKSACDAAARALRLEILSSSAWDWTP